MTKYEQQGKDFLDKTNTRFHTKYKEFNKYFNEDKEPRDVWIIRFKKSNKEFSVTFGQSIVNQGEIPTPYDVLTCLTKYDPGSFEDFCNEYGYNSDSRKAEKIYHEVCKEWSKVSSFWTKEELELLREIQ